MINSRWLFVLLFFNQIFGMYQSLSHSRIDLDKKFGLRFSNFIKLDEDTQRIILAETIEAQLDHGPVLTIQGHEGWITCLANLSIGDNQNLVASGSWDSLIRIWDINTGECLKVLRGHLDKITCIINLQKNFIASASQDRTIRIWDALTGECLKVFTGHHNRISCLISLGAPEEDQDEGALSGMLASGSYDGTIRIWDISSGDCVHQITNNHEIITSLLCLKVPNNTFIGDQKCSGNKIIVSGSISGYLKVWDPETGNCLRLIECFDDYILKLADIGEGKVVSGSKFGATKIWDIITGACLKELSGRADGILCLISLYIPGKDSIEKKHVIISGAWNNIIKVRDVKTGETLKTLTGHTDWVHSLTGLISSISGQKVYDGKIASGSDDGTIKIWDLNTSRRVQLILKKYFNISHPLTLQLCLLDRQLTHDESCKIKSLFKDESGNFDKHKFHKWLYSIHKDLRVYVMQKFGLELV